MRTLRKTGNLSRSAKNRRPYRHRDHRKILHAPPKDMRAAMDATAPRPIEASEPKRIEKKEGEQQ
jgi:hypothetical protein